MCGTVNNCTNDSYLMTCLAMANSIERVVGWFKVISGRSYDDVTMTKTYGPAAVCGGDPCNLVYRALGTTKATSVLRVYRKLLVKFIDKRVNQNVNVP